MVAKSSLDLTASPIMSVLTFNYAFGPIMGYMRDFSIRCEAHNSKAEGIARIVRLSHWRFTNLAYPNPYSTKFDCQSDILRLGHIYCPSKCSTSLPNQILIFG